VKLTETGMVASRTRIMQAQMKERGSGAYVLRGRVQVDDAYLGGETLWWQAWSCDRR